MIKKVYSEQSSDDPSRVKLEKRENLYYPSKEFQKKALVNNKKIYKEAAKNPIKFWEKLAKEIHWRKKWKEDFVHNPPYFQWFVDGKLNITESCLDKNLAKRGNKPAIIWEPEPTGENPKILTYQQLFEEVNKFANALKKLGVKKGDRVGIYLPMIPEVIISMLACARIGAVHTVVFSAFSSTALQSRLQDSEAKVLITADGYFRNGVLINLKNNADEGMKSSFAKASEDKKTKVEKMVVVKRAGNQISWQEGRDLWWHDLVAKESTDCAPEIIDSEDPLFILYTSGSTGKPKGCLHTAGGYAVQAKATTKWIFDLKPARNALHSNAGGDDDVFWSTADIGWITGHTYSCYGPLMAGATFVIFEGLLFWPQPDRWCQILEKYKVTTFYTAPTAIRMFEKYGTDILKKYKFDMLQILGSVGEPIDEDAWQWYFKEVGKERCPLVDTWWQTETGGILITSLPGIGPFKPAFAGLPFPGTKFDILDEQKRSLPAGRKGNLVLLPPFAPGLLRGIYKNPEKYKETYWSQYPSASSGQVGGVYFTSDAAYKDENGLIRIVGRVDDVLKVAGHRIATGELENAVAKHSDITECAVVGISDEIKGEVPVVFAVSSVASAKEDGGDNLKEEIIEQIKKEIGPIALPKEIYLVEDLPKTRSGKIMRRVLKRLLKNEELGDLSTLANPESVEKIRNILKLGEPPHQSQ